MRRSFPSVRRQLFWLRVYVTVSSLALVVVATAAFREASPQNLGEITVERINVVDKNGTLRLVISNKDRQWKQDQTIGLRCGDAGGQHSSSLEIWDRSDRPLSELAREFNAAQKIADAAEREKALAAVEAHAPPSPNASGNVTQRVPAR